MDSSRPAVIVVAGTGVPRFAASTVYATLAHSLDADVVALNGLGLAHTSHSVNAVTEAVARISKNDGPVVLVGHSQGGLVAAIVASEHPEMVSKVITLGAPLAGTIWCSSWGPLSGLRCMSRNSRLLGTVHSSTRMHNIVGTDDRVVVPYSSGLLPGARHYVMDRVTHTGLIYDPETIQLVSEIAKPSWASSTERAA
jgi:hypothetical protein